MNDLPELLETTEPIRQATGFIFTEGPVWHPDDIWYFNDIRPGTMYRMRLGAEPEMLRKTEGDNGMTFDLKGRLVQCEGEGNRITRQELDGRVTTLVDGFEGGRFNRPNDIICHSDGVSISATHLCEFPSWNTNSRGAGVPCSSRRHRRQSDRHLRVSKPTSFLARRAHALNCEYAYHQIHPCH